MYKRVNSYNLSFWPSTQATFNCFTKFPSAFTQLTQGHGHLLCLPNRLIRRQGKAKMKRYYTYMRVSTITH
jgi:hypothetical protein